MLRHSPLPPLVLGSALALGIALTEARTAAPFEASRPRAAPVLRSGAASSPGDAIPGAAGARRPDPLGPRHAL